MRYEVILSKKFRKSFQKLDMHIQNIIKNWIDKNLENCENPRAFGKALQGKYKGQWRYRVGDYRLLAKIVGR